MAKEFRFQRAQLIRRPLAEVWDFFATAANLEELTPRFLRFRILTPQPIAFEPGAVIDYRLQLLGIPFRWRTVIESVEPMHRFTDLQVRGPYRLWHHTHEFFPVAEGTLMVDTVRYSLYPFGWLVHAPFVRPSLDKIFDYRREAAERIFAGHPAGSRPQLSAARE